MFQIVCALALEVPSVLLDLKSLHGLSPNVILTCEPWGHMDHSGGGCKRLSSDSMGAYVHNLSLASCGRDFSPVMEEAPSAEARDEESSVHSVDFSRDCESADSGAGRPGSVPFVSHRPWAYGRLLLCTCDGRRASWWRQIGCVLLRGGLAGGSASHSAECG